MNMAKRWKKPLKYPLIVSSSVSGWISNTHADWSRAVVVDEFKHTLPGIVGPRVRKQNISILGVIYYLYPYMEM